MVTIQFGIHLQKNRGIHYSIQYSLIKILRYSVFNSVFTICNFKVFSIQFSIQQAEVLSIQYSTQCSNQFSVFTQYSIHDGIWSIQYSMYSVLRYSLVSLDPHGECYGTLLWGIKSPIGRLLGATERERQLLIGKDSILQNFESIIYTIQSSHLQNWINYQSNN